jgi:hypothetical protein
MSYYKFTAVDTMQKMKAPSTDGESPLSSDEQASIRAFLNQRITEITKQKPSSAGKMEDKATSTKKGKTEATTKSSSQAAANGKKLSLESP